MDARPNVVLACLGTGLSAAALLVKILGAAPCGTPDPYIFLLQEILLLGSLALLVMSVVLELRRRRYEGRDAAFPNAMVNLAIAGLATAAFAFFILAVPKMCE